MCPGLVELVALAEVKDHLLRVGQAILKVNEMEHKVTDCVENYILSQYLWYTHSLAFLTCFVALSSGASVPSL